MRPSDSIESPLGHRGSPRGRWKRERRDAKDQTAQVETVGSASPLSDLAAITWADVDGFFRAWLDDQVVFDVTDTPLARSIRARERWEASPERAALVLVHREAERASRIR